MKKSHQVCQHKSITVHHASPSHTCTQTHHRLWGNHLTCGTESFLLTMKITGVFSPIHIFIPSAKKKTLNPHSHRFTRVITIYFQYFQQKCHFISYANGTEVENGFTLIHLNGFYVHEVSKSCTISIIHHSQVISSVTQFVVFLHKKMYVLSFSM